MGRNRLLHGYGSGRHTALRGGAARPGQVVDARRLVVHLGLAGGPRSSCSLKKENIRFLGPRCGSRKENLEMGSAGPAFRKCQNERLRTVGRGLACITVRRELDKNRSRFPGQVGYNYKEHKYENQ